MSFQFQIERAFDLIKYQFATRKGHGIHSPFVYNLVREVFMNSDRPNYYSEIESLRRSLLIENEILKIKDLGAGSRVTDKENIIDGHRKTRRNN